VEEAFECFKRMSLRTITEVPAPGEAEACGGESKEIARKVVVGRGVFVGYTPSHLGEYNRDTWLHLSGNQPRTDLDAWIGVSHPDRHKFTLERSNGGLFGDWVLNGKYTIRGVNAWNLMQFNVVWPDAKWWRVQAYAAYSCLDFKSDVRLWNLLVTSTGIKAIDYMTKFPEDSDASYHANIDENNLMIKIDEKINRRI
jgi:hypothetical protein